MINNIINKIRAFFMLRKIKREVKQLDNVVQKFKEEMQKLTKNQ